MQRPRVIIETQYFPSVGWFVLGSSSGMLHLDMAENYNKRSLRNKTRLTQTIPHVTLTVPLKKGKHTGRTIGLVQVAYDEDWTTNHIRAIQSTYGKSPYFIHYIDEIITILEEANNLLVDLNEKIITFLMRVMKLEFKINTTIDFIKYSTSEALLFRDQVKFTKFLSPIESEIESDINQLRTETHVPFDITARSSILDLLFYLGPESRLFLNKLKLPMTTLEDSAVHKPHSIE